MNKQNQILTALLAIQIVVLAIVFWPSSPTSSGERLFGNLSADQVVRVTVRDASGNQVVMERGAGGWKLPDADDYPVNEEPVVALLEKIVNISGDRLVTRTSGSHKRLKVADDDFERRIEFELAGGAQHKLYLGTTSSPQVLHVRAGDEDAVYLALGLTTYEARAEVTAWIDPAYLSISQAEVVAVTLTNQNGRFEFAKDAAGAWTMQGLAAGETLNQDNVTSLVNRAASMRMQRPLGQEEQASYGFGAPTAVVAVQAQGAEGERTYIVRVGALLEDGYVVKSATSPYYVLMADYTVSSFVENARQDFLELPPTPAPEPATTP
jgi:hypothetical protein